MNFGHYSEFLMLWIDFANSLAHDPLGHAPPSDRLDDREWLDKFLAEHDLQPVARSRSAMSELRALRALLHRLAFSMATEGEVGDDELGSLDHILRSTRVRAGITRKGDRYECRMAADATPLVNAKFAVAASCAEFLASGDLTRIRLCENPDCRWIFFDASRNRTRRWCADSCGNLIKVRRFRERQAEREGP
jgi:predicted RNA-binding Zn ribbon-like protein